MTDDESYRQAMDGPLPEGPLAPDGIGEVLHAILNPQPQPGPPYVHTIRPPEPEYDENGDPYWPLEPSFTLEPYDLTAEPVAFVEFHGSPDPDSLDYGGLLNLLPPRRGVQVPCSIHPGRMIGENGCPRCREIRNHHLGRDA